MLEQIELLRLQLYGGLALLALGVVILFYLFNEFIGTARYLKADVVQIQKDIKDVSFRVDTVRDMLFKTEALLLLSMVQTNDCEVIFTVIPTPNFNMVEVKMMDGQGITILSKTFIGRYDFAYDLVKTVMDAVHVDNCDIDFEKTFIASIVINDMFSSFRRAYGYTLNDSGEYVWVTIEPSMEVNDEKQTTSIPS